MKKLIIFCSILFSSCHSDVKYSEYISMLGGWEEGKPATFQYQTEDTISKYNLYIMLRNDNSYPYSNIFLITKMETPDNQMVVDTLEYEMAKPNGEWLGDGVSVKESKLWYKENVSFPKKGNYSFSIEQADRTLGQNYGVKNLEGITEVGLSIEKISKK